MFLKKQQKIQNSFLATDIKEPNYHKVWLLGTCTYIFWRNVLLNLPYLFSACTYREYCSKAPLLYKTFSTDAENE